MRLGSPEGAEPGMPPVGAAKGAFSPLCFAECSLDAEGFCVRHVEIRTLLGKERANFDLVVSAHERGERTLRKT